MLKSAGAQANLSCFEKTILPKNIKYIDEVLDEEFIIKDFMKVDTWTIFWDARKFTLKFSRIPEYIEKATKIYLARYLLDEKVTAAIDSFTSITAFFENTSTDISFSDIVQLKVIFMDWLNSGKPVNHYAPNIRIFLAFLAENNFGLLHPSQVAQIKTWPVPKIVKHLRVINGTYKLTFHEEFKINRYLESEIEFFLTNPKLVEDGNIERLLFATVIALCMSFGLRPKQLAMLRVASIQKHGNSESYYDIAVPVIKQKHKRKDFFRKALPSKWQQLIIKWWEFKKSLLNVDQYAVAPLLTLSTEINSALYFTKITRGVTAQLQLEPKTVYHFRHTFAQRMADSGASAAEISVALTQTTTESAQAYVSATANMARVISEALGRSEVYKNIPDIFSGRLIIKKELDHAPQDNKIIGVVDGIIMPGIGLCSAPVNVCQRSPLLACHTCPKFMPVMDVEPHLALAEQLRSLVLRFKSVETDVNVPSSPLKKLGDTLAVIEKLIQEIRLQETESEHE